jgi:hypothetical protein
MEFHGDGHRQAVNILKGKLEANRPGCDSGLMLHDDALIQVTRGGRHTHGTQHLAAAKARVSGRRSVLWTPAAWQDGHKSLWGGGDKMGRLHEPRPHMATCAYRSACSVYIIWSDLPLPVTSFGWSLRTSTTEICASVQGKAELAVTSSNRRDELRKKVVTLPFDWIQRNIEHGQKNV